MELRYPNKADFGGTVAVVTGGSRGTGAAISRLLAARGATVVVSSRDEVAVAAVASSIRTVGGRAIAVAADCTDVAAIERLRRRVEDEFGPADVLVAMAGGFRRCKQNGRGERDSPAVAANLTATFLTVKCFLPGMVERRRGAIVTLPSVAVFTRHLARTARPYGVHIESVDARCHHAWVGGSSTRAAVLSAE